MKLQKETQSELGGEIDAYLEQVAEHERKKEIDYMQEKKIEIEILVQEMIEKAVEGDLQGVHEYSSHLANITTDMVHEPLTPNCEIVNINVLGPLPLKDLDPIFQKYLEHGNHGNAKKVNLSTHVTGSFEYCKK